MSSDDDGLSTGHTTPGATVTATNRQTQTASVAVSDSTGFFTFPNLSAGRYDVTAELQGFKKALQKDVALDAAGSLTLDFTLATGAVTEPVSSAKSRVSALAASSWTFVRSAFLKPWSSAETSYRPGARLGRV